MPTCTALVASRLVTALVALVATFGLTAQQPDRLLVCNKGAASLSIFDLSTRREIAVVPTGTGPHEVAVSPDGRLAVVSDYGDRMPGHTLTVVDVLRGERLRTIEIFRLENGADGGEVRKTCPRPHGIQFVGPDRVLVTSEASRRLVLVDITSGRAVRTWTTPQRTMHMVALAADASRAFATSIQEGDLAVFDLRGEGQQPVAVVACGEGAEGLAVDPLHGCVWVGNRAADSLTVVDPATGAVRATLPTGDFPFRVAFAPRGGRALVSCAESGEVQVFDSGTHERLRSIAITAEGSEVGAMPMGLCTDADGRYAYVACGRGEFVAVLDLERGELVDRLKARSGPDGIVVARVTGDGAPSAPAEPAVIR